MKSTAADQYKIPLYDIKKQLFDNDPVTLVKLFPGNVLGPGFVKAIKGPLPNIKVMVTGGVEPTQESIQSWLKAGANYLGMGSQLFAGELKTIMALFNDDPELFDSRFLDKVEESIGYFLDNKVEVNEDIISKETKSFKFTKFLPRKNDKKISYKMILPETNETVTDDIKKLFSSKVPPTDKLNYYKR
jgi:hypothetical protein